LRTSSGKKRATIGAAASKRSGSSKARRNLKHLPIELEAQSCVALVEATRGTRGKYAYDEERDVFALDGLLPAGMAYPCDFGFVPSTLAPDGDPTDVMILHDEPIPVGASLRVRLIAVIEAEQDDSDRGKGTVRNDRLVGVACESHSFEQIRSIGDLGERLWDELLQFWVNYNALKGKRFTVLALGDSARALEILRETRHPKRR
jgi:inorganic pyrophosphatase